ncbi:sialate O-acetylesterase [Coraliomargarita sp. SDUM461004]|uniref:Sialate O-acetylesterase n=1 Tax=Thalassobacterium sedimentorum TaxID=3041258 RepID=A0ABU1AE22_9BACT|nr:sialate O-acetylesterase [Coraliomargarita sp. SDUM461004]MDQ8192930.1 sialate O-acetylesterase [Coraliomargarita sp. SDUM461004]
MRKKHTFSKAIRPTSGFHLNGFILIALILYQCASGAELTTGTPFQDGAVLQHGKVLPIWGTAEPKESVTLKFAEQTTVTQADQEGNWMVELQPLPISRQGLEMTISTPSQTKRVKDILVGDVWICAGQSNMAFKLRQTENADEAIATADYPLIRQLLMPNNPSGDKPQSFVKAEWTSASSSTAGEFSGVAYYFGRELYESLNIPIGLINASVGGTGVEAWTSQEALQNDPNYPAIQQRWQQVMAVYPAKMEQFKQNVEVWKNAREDAIKRNISPLPRAPRKPAGPQDRNRPSALFNGMINPLIPYAAKGFIWYQGEHNAFRSDEYASLFMTMITQWRNDFAQGSLPFYFVQLPNRDLESDGSRVAWAALRLEQAKALTLPNTGMAVTIDIGDSRDTHPKNKLDVGRRLAWIALSQTYHKKIPYASPTLKQAKAQGSEMLLTFKAHDGLELREDVLPAFEIRGSSDYELANVSLSGNTVTLSSPKVKNPTAARYAWSNDPPVALYSKAGLPAAPFSIDITTSAKLSN